MTDIYIGIKETIAEDWVEVKSVKFCCTAMNKWMLLNGVVKITTIEGGDFFNPRLRMRAEGEIPEEKSKIILNYCPYCGQKIRILHHITGKEFEVEKSRKEKIIGCHRYHEVGIRLKDVQLEEGFSRKS